MNVKEIQRGWDVYGSDGEKVGDVSDVQGTYVVISKGLIFKSERYARVAAISRVEHDRVYLNVTKDEIDARGWDTVPETDERIGEQRAATTAPPAMSEGNRRVPVHEERLDADKRQGQIGEVEVRKEVVSEQVEVPVELRREGAHVEQRDVKDRPVDPSDKGVFDEGTTRVPIRGEGAVVDKQAYVTGEVVVDKEQTTERQTVSDTVRKERVMAEEHRKGADDRAPDDR